MGASITSFSKYCKGSSQIIADHTVVTEYSNIPQYWIDEVKKMLVWDAGMSHSLGHLNGVDLLETLDSKFQAAPWLTNVPAASSSALRIGRWSPSSAGIWSSDYWRGVHCTEMADEHSNNNPYHVFFYTWCYDMTWHNAPGGTEDSTYNVSWAGDSEFPDAGRWGLDAADNALTGNTVNMDTYFSSINAMIADAATNDYHTTMVFTTGPVDEDSGTETGYQRELKNDYIRAYVAAHPEVIFYDYADILVHNNSGEKNTVNWNDGGDNRAHAQIHADNLLDYDGSWTPIAQDGNGNPWGEDHIGEVGALRLAKAMWWLLARIAGWDGN